MKVVFIWRGPSPYRVNFFNELGKYCDVTVLFEMRPLDIKDKNQSWFDENYNNFKAIYLKGKFYFNRYWFCKDIIKYINLLKSADIVVVGMYSTPTQMLLINLLRILNIPYVLNSDGGFIKTDNKLTRFVKKYFITGAKAYLSSGDKTTEYLKYYGAHNLIYKYPFTSAMKADVTIKTDSETKKIVRRKLGISNDIVFLFSGQFIHRKGIDILLKACKSLPNNCSVYIVGGKPSLEYLEIIKSLELNNIYFIDFKTPKELSQYYLASDIYVLPTREDIWGLVINEAMAYGLPVLTTYQCLAGMELIKNGENGFLFDCTETDKLHEYMIRLSQDAHMRQRMSIANKKKIQSYTIENMAIEHFSIFKSILKIQN